MNQSQPWGKNPAIRLLVIQVIGIWVGIHSEIQVGVVLSITAILWLGGVFVLVLKRRTTLKIKRLRGVLLAITLFALFIFTTILSDSGRHRHHFERCDVEAYEIRATAIKNQRLDWTVIEGKVVCTRDQGLTSSATGKILVHLKHRPQVEIGDRIELTSPFRPIVSKPYTNSGGYVRYLHNHQLYFETWADTQSYRLLARPAFNLNRTATRLNQILAKRIDDSGCETITKGVLKSIVLGNRSGLNPDLKKQFSDSGTLHVLAISGLHTGIIYALLSQLILLIPFRFRKSLGSLVMIAGLWLFACVTGLSTSVCRSALMFSLFITASALNRKGNSINSWGIAALVLLLINPYWLLDVGFQFSFLAVGGILLWVRPLQYKTNITNLWMKRLTELLLLSACAQLAILPLSLFYFGSLPTYFLVSNLLIVPAIAVILLSGLLLIFTQGYVGDTIEFIADSYVFWIDVISRTVADLPDAVIYLSISGKKSILLMISVYALITALAFPKSVHDNLKITMIILLLLCTVIPF